MSIFFLYVYSLWIMKTMSLADYFFENDDSVVENVKKNALKSRSV